MKDQATARALIVEDNADFRRFVVRKYLSGFEVRELGSGTKFLSTLASSEFHLILMDYQLPDADGDELVRLARSAGYRGGIVGISSSEYLNRKLEQAGADASVEKRKRYQLPMVIRRALAIGIE